MFDLTGKTALVTGASGGIGGAIAKALHAQGATVCLSGTRREALEAVAAELGNERVHIVTANLSDAASVEQLAKEAEAALGSLDILVNNAGLTKDGLVLRMKDDDWQSVLDVNLSAAFRLCRAAVKGMMKRRVGRIINITSIVGVTGNPGQVNYAASKAGLIGHVQVAGAGSRVPWDHRELHRPGVYHFGDDRRIDRRPEVQAAGGHPRRPYGLCRRNCRRRRLSGKQRGRLCHRPDLACQRRYGHDLGGHPDCLNGAAPRCWSSPEKCVRKPAPFAGQPGGSACIDRLEVPNFYLNREF